jgi:hypothetical protein
MSSLEHTEESPAPAREPEGKASDALVAPDPASFILAMQRSAGNQAVGRYLASRRSHESGRSVRRSTVGHGQTVRVRRLCEACAEASRRRREPELAVGRVLARWPGDGMTPPGDCAWTTYLPLRLSVESAKAVVSMVGACSPTDSCTFVALKIAAISAEIAARVALDATCFKGGDTGHRQQVQDKVNMLNRCYRFFQGGNCPAGLLTAMEAVVAVARQVIEGAVLAVAAAVVIAAVVALVAAVIALADAIAAIAAAAAEATVVVEALAALTALLTTLQQQFAGAAP